MTDAPKTCADCKHGVRPTTPGLYELSLPPNRFQWRCARLSAPKVDLVTGDRLLTSLLICADERGLSTACGEDGKFWEPKYPQLNAPQTHWTNTGNVGC